MEPTTYLENITKDMAQIHQMLGLIAAKLDGIAKQHKKENDDLLGVEETAKFLGITKGALYAKAYRNSLPYYRSTGKLYFSKQELLEKIYQLPSSTTEKHEDERKNANAI